VRGKLIRELVAADGIRKVRIFEREDASFGFEALRYSDDPYELSWIPDGRYSECYADTAARAEAEARGRVPWLRLASSG
jgi:hypothetical protein